jgi:2-oxoisovalerate dehydrogenase E1 component alpha subunit
VGPSFAARGPGYGLPGLRVDGNDFLAVYAATRWAADRARQGLGTTVIELVTYRAAAHSTSDDPSRYRPKDEEAAWPLGDPVERLKNHLIALREWNEERHQALIQECEEHITQSWEEACSYGTLNEGPRQDPLTMFDDVLKEMPEHLRKQRDQLARERS